MGTTSEKLTYLNVTKQKLKQAINNIGGEVTDETTFRQYVNQLQNVYDNLPKTEYQEGTEVNLGKTIKGKLDYDNGVVGIGQTEQDTTQGYQLLDTSSSTQPITSQGITISPNGDGTFRVYGTASANVNFIIAKYTFTSGNKYTMTNGLTDNQYGKYTLLMGTYAQWGQNTLINGEYSTFTAGTSEEFNILIQVYSGTTLNVVMKPLMYSGEYSSSKTFEPYTGGQASPNPSYEQEIEVVRGKNRFDGELLPNSYNPTTGEIEASSTSYRSNKIPLQKNETYYLSGITGNVRVLYWNNTSYVSSEVITMPNSFITKGNIIAFQFDKSLSHENIMIEKGSQATSYLPYNTIEEVVSGKNKLQQKLPTTTLNGITCTNNGDGSYTFSGTASANVNFRIDQSTTDGTDNLNTYKAPYTMVASIVTGTPIGSMFLGGYSDSESWSTPLCNIGTVRTITSNINNAFCYIRFETGNVVNETIYPMILDGEYTSSNIPNFEPYITPTSYQLSLGDKELFEECTIVGSPDNWKFVDNYYKEKISITDRQISNTSGKYRFILGTTYNTKQTPNSSVADIYSNILTKNSANNNYLRNNSIAINDVGQILIYWEDWAEYSVQEMQDYFANRDDYIVYPLATPIETPITDETLISQLNAWYNAHSLNGTTIITSNGNLPMIIKVRGLKGE